MNTAQHTPATSPHLASRIRRICTATAVSAVLATAWVAGSASAASAAAQTPVPHVAAQATAVTSAPAHGHPAPAAQRGGGDYGDDDECDGLIIVLCI